MKKSIYFLLSLLLVFTACKKEENHNHHHDTTDSSAPIVLLNSPSDSLTYQNGDTVFIIGSVTDNEMHEGTIVIKDDTTQSIYYNQIHAVHDLTSSNINFFYIVNGVTQNSAATLTVTYEDHQPNYGTVTRKLVFIP